MSLVRRRAKAARHHFLLQQVQALKLTKLMPRPHKDNATPSAQDRIETAFWNILEENQADQLTVKYLCSRADVYPNTLYYHYDSIQDVAESAFSRSMLRELPAFILSGNPLTLFNQAQAGDKDLMTRVQRTILFASCELDYARPIIVKHMKDIWSRELHVRPEELSNFERNMFTFVSHGLIALMGEMRNQNPAVAMMEIVSSPLGKGLMEQMRLIKKAHSS